MTNIQIEESGGGYCEKGLVIHLNHVPSTNNVYESMVKNQKIALVSSFTLQSGISLENVPVAYSTWGALNSRRDNVLVLCHALTGSSDAQDWWAPLMGAEKALDYCRYFIFCANVLGSPYGSASPLTTDPSTGSPYGPTFPATTIRDDIRIQKLILDALGVRSVAAVIGGSMGGMATLEWPLCTPASYVNNIIPIATSAYHGAWGISWGETQRQCIHGDASFLGGWYDPSPDGQPRSGLGTARMIAMLTYRSGGSFEHRFGRKSSARSEVAEQATSLPTPPCSHRGSLSSGLGATVNAPPAIDFAAQSYMQYQAEKFLRRFDANCYIHLTKKMDAHDITAGRVAHQRNDELPHLPSITQLNSVLGAVPPKALVVSVETDILFRPEQQLELAECLPDARLVTLDSLDGHDGFLLEFETLNEVIKEHLREICPWIYEGQGNSFPSPSGNPHDVVNSVFGEAEVDQF
ncbi:homoserine O-acetyltransferase [Clohesyomyces aquaticus]|uniref:Homoserine O-acetyltransferase n=1 Tax=Clohesyomyces aquaticus TaxID=1231657 RepID=A0A1Y1ZZF8_9PLEO|nr:homoserine O-acetyltransferase [Clohesyomyces aquaticus]